MLCLIPIVGGLLIMMGQHERCEALFYYFRLEDQVPENHLLRLIDKHITFEFVREQLKDCYRGNICRWMAASWRQTPPKKVGFHGNSWWKRPRFITLCVSICRNWNSRTRQKNRCISKNRYRPPILIPLTPPRAARQLGWGTTITIWLTTTVA